MNKASRCQLTEGSHGEFVVLEDTFNSCLRTLFYNNKCMDEPAKDFHSLLNSLEGKIADCISQEFLTYGPIKFNLVLEATYQKSTLDQQNQEKEEIQNVAFKTPNYPVFGVTEISSLIKTACQKMLEEEAKFEGNSSGWTLLIIDGLLIRISRNTPLRGSSYIELPAKISARKAVINPMNNDQQCFKWAILAKHVGGGNIHRVNDRYYELVNKYNFDGITFPTTIYQIDTFERNNPGVSVNVYGLDADNNIFPRRVVKEVKDDHTDLLLLGDSEESDDVDVLKTNSHYCWIKNFERLLRAQLTKRKSRIIICRRCFTHYTFNRDGERRLKEHEEFCATNKTARIVMPKLKEDGSAPTMQFEKHLNKFRLPLVVYADFECLLEKPVPEEEGGAAEKWIGNATKVIQYHRAMSYCLYFVRDENQLPSWLTLSNLIPQEPLVYRGPDAANHFMKTLTRCATDIAEAIDLEGRVMLPLTDQQRADFEAVTHCEACNKKFNGDKVRDHCHMTGFYRNALCNKCNLMRRRQTYVPVFLHNSSNYDTHLIIPHLGSDKSKISVIPRTSEKYISFTKQISKRLHLRFIDTIQFIPDSLDNLVTNLVKSAENATDLPNVLKHTAKEFRNELDLVSRKGVFPYEYCNSWEKLEETSLPSKEEFYSLLRDCGISDADYAHAQHVWRHFKCRTLGAYSDLYLKTDVLLLADVFESFRDVCMRNYDLDCAHYFTSPGFSFDVMLKSTKVELELLTDYDMYMFVEHGIRGGISICVHRHAIANNKYTGAPLDPEKPTSYLLYTDANNLYGWAMCNPLPCGKFQWMGREELEAVIKGIEGVGDTQQIGYILQVDVEYPAELHNHHNDFPFLPDNQKTQKTGSVRLMATLQSHQKYVCHYRLLKQAVQHGLRITKIHRGLRFEQKKFLAPYILMNTHLRQQSKNKFEKNFFKLMNNAVFGKTMESVRKRMNMELVNDEKRLKKLVARPSFKDRIIFGQNICAITLHKEKVVLDKPIYIGLSVLDISKILMYQFHYDVMHPIYNDRLKLLYQDTDSLFYLVETEDMYKDINNIEELRETFDTSEYPTDHPCYSNANKMVLGKFKDEYASRAPHEYVGLRSKLYACRCFHTDESQLQSGLIKKAKGVRRPILGQELPKTHPNAKHYIGFQDYLDCLYEDKVIFREQVMFHSKKHQLMTTVQKKKALSNTDEKRFIMDDGITTLALGHKDIAAHQQLVNDEGNSSSIGNNDDDDDDDSPCPKRLRIDEPYFIDSEDDMEMASLP